ncbi:hypothetical protein [Azohydromonas caseinilytica]|uniref:Ornithine carbamoyltransferase n=1 Tax=Azohydromonas caseinilytica TaxID=2728836 RepID=A0A848FEZ3_9BURK|nr:hypothetical protein [Azohydromonas caseinilytica]NML17656.1 hypothetical protein [Azohydromonas caseinilytica]
MKPLPSAPLFTAGAVPTGDGEAVLRTALMLRSLAQAGTESPFLRGKHLALVSASVPSSSQDRVETAARRLGARVARLSALAVQGEGARAQDTGRMLGLLYDALDCEDLPAAVLLRLREDCGVPVYEGLGRMDHPVALLLPCLAGATDPAGSAPEDNHCFLLQALLVRTLL